MGKKIETTAFMNRAICEHGLTKKHEWHLTTVANTNAQWTLGYTKKSAFAKGWRPRHFGNVSIHF